jgi:hypothetical protein
MLGIGECKGPLLCCFFVGAYVSHPSVLDTSGTFININPCENELLIFEQTIMSYVSFPFFSLILIYG